MRRQVRMACVPGARQGREETNQGIAVHTFAQGDSDGEERHVGQEDREEGTNTGG